MHAFFINDCSRYHVGSALVAQELKRLCAELGIQLTRDAKKQTALTLVNGEGSMHHSAPRSLEILEQMEKAALTSPVVLLNTVWQNMPAKLPYLSWAIARESASAAALWRDAECQNVRILPDISLCCRYRPPAAQRRGLLFVDSISKRTSTWASKAAEKFSGTYIQMCEWKQSPTALIDLMSRYDGVVTGRFHGVTLALLAGTPVIALPSNTHKTGAMMRDFCMDSSYCNSWESLCAALDDGRFGSIDSSTLALIEYRWRYTLQELLGLSLKPKPPTSPIKPDATCVLVGNGPSSIGAGLGKLIDAHDEVVRFNNYAVEGFEKDVGARTTLWSTFGKGSKPLSGAVAKRAIFIHGENGSPHLPMDEVYRIERRFYEAMRRELRNISRHRNAANINPTSGFLVTRWLLECGVRRLHLVGFDHFAKHASSRHHYWNECSYGRPHDHDGDAEALLLRPFTRMGRLNYLTGLAGHHELH